MGREIHARETRFGRYFEEFELGDVYHHWPGKTITEADDHLFCMLTMNHHPLHTDAHYAETETQFGRNVVVGNLVYSLVLGMSVPDVSGKAIANLEIESLRHARPTFHGDTIYARTTVLDKRESQSKPDRGIVTVETVGWNQREETVCEFRRRVLVPKRPWPRATAQGLASPVLGAGGSPSGHLEVSQITYPSRWGIPFLRFHPDPGWRATNRPHCTARRWPASCSLPSGASARSQASYRSSTERVVFKLLNDIRREHKLPPFTFSAALRRSAREHSADMLARQYFEHNAPNETFDHRIRRHLNSTLVGENIAWGTGRYATPQGLVKLWMHSPRTATSSSCAASAASGSAWPSASSPAARAPRWRPPTSPPST